MWLIKIFLKKSKHNADKQGLDQRIKYDENKISGIGGLVTETKINSKIVKVENTMLNVSGNVT